MAGKSMAWVCVLLMAACVHTATANVFTLEWTFQTTQDSYTLWAANQTFQVGDQIQFVFDSTFHDVAEVTQADESNCVTTNPIKRYSGSNVTVTLTRLGYHGFICTFPAHCAGGMKINLQVASGSPSASPTSAPVPSPSGTVLTPTPVPSMSPSAATPASSPTPVPSPSVLTTPVLAPVTVMTPTPTPTSTPSSVPSPAQSTVPPSTPVPALSPVESPASPPGSNGVVGVESRAVLVAGAMIFGCAALFF